MMKSRPYLSLGDAIQQFLERHGLKEKTKVQEVIAQWEQLMGKPIAGNTEKLWFNDGVLYIKMSSPVWVNELSLARGKIRELVNQRMQAPVVKEVRIF
ncbi:MAG: DUF721 domain-containing protein [Bacteroidetes bacterium]|nr:MAG: DUF721 domain-containing protein [Bacteroidota bacterium]